MSYYQLPRISNSDLTIAAHILQDIPYQKPETASTVDAVRLGGAFHELLLEPEKFRTESCEGIDIALLYRLITDFKTTSARSLRAFINCCQQYNYDRQMAFYADSIGVQQVCLIGVSKKAKRLFFVQKYASSAFIAEGRRKYRFLLQHIKELDLYEAIYFFEKIAESLFTLPPIMIGMFAMYAYLVYESQALLIAQLPETLLGWQREAAAWFLSVAIHLTILTTAANSKLVHHAFPVLFAIAGYFITTLFFDAWNFEKTAQGGNTTNPNLTRNGLGWR